MKLRPLLFTLLLLPLSVSLRAAEILTYPLRICNSTFFNRPSDNLGNLNDHWNHTYAVKFVINDPQFGIVYPPNQQTIYLNSVSLGIFPGQNGVDNLGAELRSSDHATLHFAEVKAIYNDESLSFKDGQTQTWTMATFTFPHPIKVDMNTQYKLDFTPGDANLDLAYGTVDSSNKICSVFWDSLKRNYYDSKGKSPVVSCIVSQPQTVGEARCWSALPEAIKGQADPILDFTGYPQNTPFILDTNINWHSLTIVGTSDVTFKIKNEDTADPQPSINIQNFVADTNITGSRHFWSTIQSGPVTVPAGKTFTVDINGGEFYPNFSVEGEGTLRLTGGQMYNVGSEHPLNVREVLIDGGRLRFIDGVADEQSHTCHITAKKDGYIQISNNGRTKVTLPEGITMHGGSMLKIHNQSNNTAHTAELNTPIIITETTDTASGNTLPVTIINNAISMGDAKLSGSLSGTGSVILTHGEEATSQFFQLAASSAAETTVLFRGGNVNTSGTFNGPVELQENALLYIPTLNTLSSATTVKLGTDAIIKVTTPLSTDAELANLTGDGTVQLTFQTHDSNREDAPKFVNFSGTTEVLDGYVSFKKGMAVGCCLRMVGGKLKTTEKTYTFDKKLDIVGSIEFHCNKDKHKPNDLSLAHDVILTQDLVGSTPAAELKKYGSGQLILQGPNNDLSILSLYAYTKTAVGNVVVNGTGVFNIHNVTKESSGDNTPRLQINENCTLKVCPGATYSASGPLTLDSGAMLDVTDGAKLSVHNSHVTLPDATGSVLSVRIPKGNINYPLLLIDGGITHPSLPDSCLVYQGEKIVDGYHFLIEDNRLLLDIKPLIKPNKTEKTDTEDATAYTQQAINAILDANNHLRPTAIVANINGKELNAEEVSQLTRVIHGVAYTEENAAQPNTVCIDYHFGVAGINIVSQKTAGEASAELYVVLKAEVTGGNGNPNPVSYGFGSQLTVYQDATVNQDGTLSGAIVQGVAEVTDATGRILGSNAGNTRYLRFPMAKDGKTHHYSLSLNGTHAELISGEVTIPTRGAEFVVTYPQSAQSLLTLTPKQKASQLALRFSGPGTYEGQVYTLQDNANKELATATMTANGVVVFNGFSITEETSVSIIAQGVTGDITVSANTWDASGVTEGLTVNAQGMLAIHPRYDFRNLTGYGNIAGDEGINAPNDPKHSQYRIPGVATDGKGEVIAVYDIRWRSQDDLGVMTNTQNGSWSPIDIGESYSGNNGTVWNRPKIGIDVPNIYEFSDGSHHEADVSRDIGDPCIVYYPGNSAEDTEKQPCYFVMGITGGGLAGYGGKGCPLNGLALYKRTPGEASSWVPVFPNDAPSGMPDNTSFKGIVLNALIEAGAHLDDEALLNCTTSDDLQQLTRGVLQGPGHGFVTTIGHGTEGQPEYMPVGTIVFPMQWFYDYPASWTESSYTWTKKSYAFALYSTDGGKTWKSTRFVAPEYTGKRFLPPQDLGTQESSVCELDDGSWYLIAKHTSGGRYCYRTTDFSRWVRQDVITPSNAVQGSILRLGKNAEGIGQYAMAYSVGANRSQLQILFGIDNTETGGGQAAINWGTHNPLTIHAGNTGNKSYNSMCLLDGGKTLGFLYEANMHIYFKRIDISHRIHLE